MQIHGALDRVGIHGTPSIQIHNESKCLRLAEARSSKHPSRAARVNRAIDRLIGRPGTADERRTSLIRGNIRSSLHAGRCIGTPSSKTMRDNDVLPPPHRLKPRCVPSDLFSATSRSTFPPFFLSAAEQAPASFHRKCFGSRRPISEGLNFERRRALVGLECLRRQRCFGQVSETRKFLRRTSGLFWFFLRSRVLSPRNLFVIKMPARLSATVR